MGRSALRWKCLLLLFVAAPAARAGAVPDAHYSIILKNAAEINVPGVFSLGGESAEIENLPAPFAHAHLDGQGTSRAEMQYWFHVEGPSDGLEVPLQIAGRVRISAGNSVFKKGFVWGVTAQLIGIAFDGTLGPGVGQIDNQHESVDCSPLSEGDIPVEPPIASCQARDQDQPVLLALNALTGADNEISIVTAANNQEAFSADFDAEVDPTISFPPEFDSTGYAITVSAGVGNPAPEPRRALLECAAVGALLRLRRRSARRDRPARS
jgi:hypothetical protein